MDEILDKLGRSQYFTTIDLAKGCHQIQMYESSIQKTAFSTKKWTLGIHSNAIRIEIF